MNDQSPETAAQIEEAARVFRMARSFAAHPADRELADAALLALLDTSERSLIEAGFRLADRVRERMHELAALSS